MPARVFRFLLLASMLSVAACNESEPGPPRGEVEPGGSSGSSGSSGSNENPPKCAPDAPRHHAFLKSGPCADIAGRDGTWVASSLFPDAPKDIVETACTYRWTTSSGALADTSVLESADFDHLTKSVAETTSCDEPVLKTGSLSPLPQNPDGTSAPTGVTGCDVCGRVSGGHVFVILPADKLNLRTVVVTTNAGKFLSFEMTSLDAKTQIFSAELPPAPDGAKYNEGRISLLEKAF